MSSKKRITLSKEEINHLLCVADMLQGMRDDDEEYNEGYELKIEFWNQRIMPKKLRDKLEKSLSQFPIHSSE